MKTKLLFLLFCITMQSVAQWQWSLPLQITTGNSEDTHPAFVNSYGDIFNNIEWLAFSRSNGSGRNICLVHTNPDAQSWNDSVVTITNDELVINDNPSLARKPGGQMMLVWTHYTNDTISEVYSSWYNDTVWSFPTRISSETGYEETPMVAANATGFGVVFRRGNALVYSVFSGETWSSLDTINRNGGYDRNPELKYRSSTPIILWQYNSPLDNNAFYYTLKNESSWAEPKMFAAFGESSPGLKFFKSPLQHYPDIDVTWIQGLNLTNDKVMYLSGNISGDSIMWDMQSENISTNPEGMYEYASFAYFSLIVEKPIPFSCVGTWRTVSGGGDSIALYTTGTVSQIQYRSPVIGTIDRNPEISSGVIVNGYLKIWSVWENNSTGVFKLYGSIIDIQLGIKEQSIIPKSFSLSQNHPNPFNPSTTIEYELPKEDFVTMSVFNILGKEITTLVNEKKEAGKYSVTFNASVLPSGLYFYRLKTKGFTQTKKLVLVK